jgi:hypothetical protein
MNFPWLPTTENWLVHEPNEFCHLHSRGTDIQHRKHMSRDHYPPLREVTADKENRASSTVGVYWAVAWKPVDKNPLKYIHLYILVQQKQLDETYYCLECVAL